MRDGDAPVYMIGVVARIANIHPQTLRLYEREKLVIPKRTGGSTRLYSQNDIELIKEIQYMTQAEGLNLAGVRTILKMRKQVLELNEQLKEFENKIYEIRKQMAEEIQKVHDSYCKDIVLFRPTTLVRRRNVR